MCFVFPQSIMSRKHPSASPASGQKEKRKTMTLEMKLKIVAQL